MENYDNETLTINLHYLLNMAAFSNQYLSRVYNPKFEQLLKPFDGRKDPLTQYPLWSIEEISAILNEATIIGVNRGSEQLDRSFTMRLLANAEEYKAKPYVLKNFLMSIVQRKRFKHE